MVTKHKIDSEKFVNALYINEKVKVSESISSVIDKDILSKWRNRKNIVTDKSFNFMLNTLGYSEIGFTNSINEISNENKKYYSKLVEDSEWFNIYRDAINILKSKDFEYKDEFGFSFIIRPFIIYFKNEIQLIFQKYEGIFEEKVIIDLTNNLGNNLVQIAHKTLVLELNISKLRNELLGNTAEERFNSFNKQFENEERLMTFYDEYKTLARILATKTLFSIKNTIEFFERIEQNKNRIYDYFNIQPGEKVKKVTPGEGDSHQQGRSVIRMTFTSGKRIVYKPRNTEVGVAYHHLLSWFNTQPSVLPMTTYQLLNLGEYSLEEFISKRACSDETEVQYFFQRFGQLIALMHLLNATDMHMENVIANGDSPVIVDFETLLHNPIPYNWPDSAYVKAGYKAQELVSNTMLLPTEIKDNFLNKRGIDLSGLSGKAQKIPYQVNGPVKQNTDEMVYSLIEATMEGSNNLPELNGEVISFENYIEDIIKGFRNASYLFLNNKKELLQEDGLLSIFKGLVVRIIPRGTSQYFNMIQNTYHPDYLRKSVDREKVLENIWSVPYKRKDIIKSEYKDMLNDDIPIFFNKTDSTNLIDSTGIEYKNLFNKSGYDLLIEKINNLDEKEINRQISVIYVKTGEYSKVQSGISKKAIISSNESIQSAIDSVKSTEDNQYFIDEAIAIGEKILQNAIYAEDQKTISWLSIETSVSSGFDVMPIKGDFYDGLSGITLFFHYLYKLTKDEKYKTVREILIRTSQERVKALDTSSVFIGTASLLYPLAKIAFEENDFKIRDEMYKTIKEIEKNLDDLNHYDWISGTSSFIHVLISVFEETKNIDILTLAIKLGNKLIAQVEEKSEELIGGFSHGASSLAFVLIKLGSLGKIEKFKQKGMELLKFDRSLYSEKLNGWIDKNDPELSCKSQWCHGSEGIGISRMLIKQYYQDKTINEEIETALKVSLNSAYKNDDCLCHGNIGTTDLLLTAYETKLDKQSYIQAKKLAQYIIMKKNEDGCYKTRALEGFPVYGMFTGLSGVGYQLLRIASPNEVPSVLSLS